MHSTKDPLKKVVLINTESVDKWDRKRPTNATFNQKEIRLDDF